jgi:hypothetical protein
VLRRSLIELVDHGCDHVGARLAGVELARHQAHQVVAILRLDDGLAAGAEGAPQLAVEVDAVGHQDHARVGDGRVQRQRLGQHDHGQRLTAACRVPDDAARALPCALRWATRVQRGADGEILLVAGDLLDAVVEDDELVGEFQQPRGAAGRRSAGPAPWAAVRPACRSGRACGVRIHASRKVDLP